MASRSREEGRGGCPPPLELASALSRVRSLLAAREQPQAGSESDHRPSCNYRGQVFLSFSSFFHFLREEIYKACFHLVRSCQQVAVTYGLLDTHSSAVQKTFRYSSSSQEKCVDSAKAAVASSGLVGLRPPSHRGTSKQLPQQAMERLGSTGLLHSDVSSSAGVQTSPRGTSRRDGGQTDTAEKVGTSFSLASGLTRRRRGMLVCFFFLVGVTGVLLSFSWSFFKKERHVGRNGWLSVFPFGGARFRFGVLGGFIIVFSLVILGAFLVVCAYLITTTLVVPVFESVSVHRRLLRRWRRVAALLVLYQKFIRETLRWTQEMNVTYRAVALDREEWRSRKSCTSHPSSSSSALSPVQAPASPSCTQAGLQNAGSEAPVDSHPSGLVREERNQAEDTLLLKDDKPARRSPRSSPFPEHVDRSAWARGAKPSKEGRLEREQQRSAERQDEGRCEQQVPQQGEEDCSRGHGGSDNTDSDSTRKRKDDDEHKIGGRVERIWSTGTGDSGSCFSMRKASVAGDQGGRGGGGGGGAGMVNEDDSDDSLRPVFLRMTLTAQEGLSKARHLLMTAPQAIASLASPSSPSAWEGERRRSGEVFASFRPSRTASLGVVQRDARGDLPRHEKQDNCTGDRRDTAIQGSGHKSSTISAGISLNEMKEIAHKYWITEREFCAAFQASLLHLLCELQRVYLTSRGHLSVSSFASSSRSPGFSVKSTHEKLACQSLHKQRTATSLFPSFPRHQGLDLNGLRQTPETHSVGGVQAAEEANRGRTAWGGGGGAHGRKLFRQILQEKALSRLRDEQRSRKKDLDEAGEMKGDSKAFGHRAQHQHPSLQEELLASGGAVVMEGKGAAGKGGHLPLMIAKEESHKHMGGEAEPLEGGATRGDDGEAFVLVRQDEQEGSSVDDRSATPSATREDGPSKTTPHPGREEKRDSTQLAREENAVSFSTKEALEGNKPQREMKRRSYRFLFSGRGDGCCPWFLSQKCLMAFFLKILRTLEEAVESYEMWRFSIGRLRSIDRALCVAQDHLELAAARLHRSLLADWGRLGTLSPGVSMTTRRLAALSWPSAAPGDSSFSSCTGLRATPHIAANDGKDTARHPLCPRSEETTVSPSQKMMATFLCCPLTPPKISPLFRSTSKEPSPDIRLGLGRLNQHVAAALTLLRLGPAIAPEPMRFLSGESLMGDTQNKRSAQQFRCSSPNRTRRTAPSASNDDGGGHWWSRVTCEERASCVLRKLGNPMKLLKYLGRILRDRKGKEEIEEAAASLLPPSPHLREYGAGEKPRKTGTQKIQTAAPQYRTLSATPACSTSSSLPAIRGVAEGEQTFEARGKTASTRTTADQEHQGLTTPTMREEMLSPTEGATPEKREEQEGKEEGEVPDALAHPPTAEGRRVPGSGDTSSSSSRREDDEKTGRQQADEKKEREDEKDRENREDTCVSIDEWVHVLQDTSEHLGFAQEQCTTLLRALRQKQQGGSEGLLRLRRDCFFSSKNSEAEGFLSQAGVPSENGRKSNEERGSVERSLHHLALPAPPQTMLEVYKGLGEEGTSGRRVELPLFDDQVDPATLAKGRLAVGELREVLKAHPRLHQQRQQKRLVKELVSPSLPVSGESCGHFPARGAASSAVLSEKDKAGRMPGRLTEKVGGQIPADEEGLIFLTVREVEGEEGEDDEEERTFSRLDSQERQKERLEEDREDVHVKDMSSRRGSREDAGGDDDEKDRDYSDRTATRRVQLQEGEYAGVVVSGVGLGQCTPEQLRLERRARELADRAEARSLFSELDAQLRGRRRTTVRPLSGDDQKSKPDEVGVRRTSSGGGRVLWEGEEHQVPLDFLQTGHFLGASTEGPAPPRLCNAVMQRFDRETGEQEEELFCGVGEGEEEEEGEREFGVPDENCLTQRLGTREAPVGEWGGGPWCVEGSSLDSDSDNRSRRKGQVTVPETTEEGRGGSSVACADTSNRKGGG